MQSPIALLIALIHRQSGSLCMHPFNSNLFTALLISDMALDWQTFANVQHSSRDTCKYLSLGHVLTSLNIFWNLLSAVRMQICCAIGSFQGYNKTKIKHVN